MFISLRNMSLEQFLQQNASTISAGSGLLGTAANIGMGIYNMEQQKAMLREQMRFNKTESAKQRQFALEQWQRENAYNSPSAQMDRLRAAGINPALAYSNGSIENTGGGTPSFSEATAPGGLPQFRAQVDPGFMGDALRSGSQASLNQAQQIATEIKNAVDGMNRDVMKKFFDNGTLEQVFGQKLNVDFLNSEIKRQEFMENAWDLSIKFGTNMSDFLSSSFPGIPSVDMIVDKGGDVVEFDSRFFDMVFSKSRHSIEQTLISAGFSADQAAYAYNKALNEMNSAKIQKESTVYEFINKLTESDKDVVKYLGYTLQVLVYLFEHSGRMPSVVFKRNNRVVNQPTTNINN